MVLKVYFFIKESWFGKKNIDNNLLSPLSLSRGDRELINDFNVGPKDAISNLENTGSTCWK